MTHARLPLAAGLAAAALTLAPATAALGASAADAAAGPHRITHHDAHHDMLAYDGTSSATPPAPDQTQGDIHRFTISYRPHALQLTATFGALARPKKGMQFFAVRLKAAHGLTRNFTLGTYAGKPQGDVEFDSMTAPRGCTIGHHVDYTAHTVAFTIPASCVKRSPWVRAGLGYADVDDAAAVLSSPDGSGTTGHGDDAYRDGAVRNDLALSPRVYR